MYYTQTLNEARVAKISLARVQDRTDSSLDDRLNESGPA